MISFTKKKREVAILLGCSLVLGLVVTVQTKQNSADKNGEQSSLVAGTLGDLTEGSVSLGLTAGAIDNINDYSKISVASDSNYTSTGALIQIEEYDPDSIYGYYNLGFSQVDGNLNVRKEASSSSSVVGKLTNDNAVEIVSTSEDGSWYQITSGNVEGWVSAEYIITGDAALAKVDDLIATYATVNTDSLRVRSEASTDANILELVNDSDDLVVCSIYDDEWIEVEVDDGSGYVYAEYVTLTNKFKTGSTLEELRYGSGVSQTRVDLVEYALQFVGNRYVWGGTSLTKGVDCSGFTMKVYQHFGISLPHYSGSQPSYGTKINASDAQPGDLFFYGKHGKINHVAIYIGNGQVVHASSPKSGIKISNAFYRSPICVVSYL